MPKASYQYQCQITGKVKAYKKMSDQVARALNWTLIQRGCHDRWVVQTVSDEVGHEAGSAQQSTKAELLQPSGPALIPLKGIQQNTAPHLEKKAV